MFRTFLLISLTILIFSVAAFAQTDWHGIYAGGNAGDVLGRSTADTSTVVRFRGYIDPSSLPAISMAGRQNLDANRFTGGLEGGINFQFGNLVVGGETDYDSLRMSAIQSTTVPYPCCTTTNFTLTESFSTRWLYTARARAGIAMGRALFYSTGGLAVTKVNFQNVFTDTFANASESGAVNESKTGGVVGGGAEYRLNDHWSVKGEYLYTDFGRISIASNNLITTSPPQSFPTNIFIHSMALHGDVFRAGINYRW